jgi:hypothetical protein
MCDNFPVAFVCGSCVGDAEIEEEYVDSLKPLEPDRVNTRERKQRTRREFCERWRAMMRDYYSEECKRVDEGWNCVVDTRHGT